MKAKRIKMSASAASAGILAFALSASAAVRSLPAPPPSGYVDAESSVNVAIPTNEGRHVKLALAFESSPTNAVQVAFGRDADGNGDLAPEETETKVGVDCGEPTWNGHPARSADQSERAGCPFHSFDLKQPMNPARRWNLAKVTTHNTADTNVTVSAKFYKPGLMLIVR